jgi:hypothetical protein
VSKIFNVKVDGAYSTKPLCFKNEPIPLQSVHTDKTRISKAKREVLPVCVAVVVRRPELGGQVHGHPLPNLKV